jgi:hypothetical protein
MSKHIYYAPGDGHAHDRDWHERYNCNICDGGLAICKVCNGAEGTLTTHCPGYWYTEKEEAVYKGLLDFVDGEWITVKPTLRPVTKLDIA